jgi:hypothetical protein
VGHRVWARPELLALRRDGHEERVLSACKTGDEWPSAGPEAGYSACYIWDYCYDGCTAIGVS